MGLMFSKWVGWDPADDLHSECFGQEQVNKLMQDKDREWESAMDKERQEYNSKIDQWKAKSKRQAKEIRQLKAAAAEEKLERERLVNEEIERSTEAVVKDSRSLRQRMAKEMYAVVLAEAVKFLTFAHFVMDNFLPKSAVMEDVVSEQAIFTERIRNDASALASCQPTKQFQVHRPNGPNYDALSADVNRTKQVLYQDNKMIKATPASPQSSKPVKPSVKPQHTMESLIATIRDVFPSMSDIDVIDGLVKIKALNHGTLTGLSMDQIMRMISSDASSNNSDDSDAVKQPEACAICIEPMNPNESKLTSMEGCGHTFHDDCIRTWLTKKQQCPCCRLDQVDGGWKSLNPTTCMMDTVRQYSIWNSSPIFIDSGNSTEKAWN